uniref:relaxase/mobilization nuclease domain-containing protein n=1 Tax=Methylobacterium guangdongense TaxID=3138811 RepID=UPI00313ED8EA
MIALSTKIEQFERVIAYDLGARDHQGRERPRVVLLHATLPGRSPQEIARSFERLRSLRPRLTKAGLRTILSFRPDAAVPSDETARAVAIAWAVRQGFQDFTVVRHDDRHLHICSSRVRRDGTVVSDSHDFRRSEMVVRDLEREFQIAPDRSSHLTDPAVSPPLAG